MHQNHQLTGISSETRNGRRKTATPKSVSHPLIGLYFLSYKADEKCHWQGHVRDVIKDDILLVQLFSWWSGDPTNMTLVPIAETLSNNDSKDEGQAAWRFYRDHEEWIEAGHRATEANK